MTTLVPGLPLTQHLLYNLVFCLQQLIFAFSCIQRGEPLGALAKTRRLLYLLPWVRTFHPRETQQVRCLFWYMIGRYMFHFCSTAEYEKAYLRPIFIILTTIYLIIKKTHGQSQATFSSSSISVYALKISLSVHLY